MSLQVSDSGNRPSKFKACCQDGSRPLNARNHKAKGPKYPRMEYVVYDIYTYIYICLYTYLYMYMYVYIYIHVYVFCFCTRNRQNDSGNTLCIWALGSLGL